MDTKRLAACLRELAEILDGEESPKKQRKAPVKTEPVGSGILFEKETGTFFGVSREAKRLGVSIVHLSAVLHGRRKSNRLMARVKIKEVK